MKLHTIPIAIAIIALFVMCTVTYIADVGDKHSVNADFSTINRTTANLQEMNEKADNMTDVIDDFVPDTGTEVLMIPYTFLRSAWFAADYMWSSVKTLTDMIPDIISSFTGIGIPASVGNQITVTITIIILITAVASIVYAFFKWKFED